MAKDGSQTSKFWNLKLMLVLPSSLQQSIVIAPQPFHLYYRGYCDNAELGPCPKLSRVSLSSQRPILHNFRLAVTQTFENSLFETLCQVSWENLRPHSNPYLSFIAIILQTHEARWSLCNSKRPTEIATCNYWTTGHPRVVWHLKPSWRDGH